MNASTLESGIRRARGATKGVWSLLLTGCLGCATTSVPPSSSQLQVPANAWSDGETRGIDLLVRLTQHNTQQPLGQEEAAARTLKNFLAGQQITSEMVPLSPKRASLVARLSAQNRRYDEPLVLLSHLDTHPASKTMWPENQGPRSGAIVSDAVWGRGVLDGKGLAALHAVVLTILAQAPASLERDVVVVATADGLSPEGRGLQSVLASHPDVGRASMVLTKGGGSWIGLLKDKQIAHTVATSEKGFIRLKVTATNRGGQNAVDRLQRALNRVVPQWPRVRLTAPTQETLVYAAAGQPFFLRWLARQSFVMQAFFVSDMANREVARDLVSDTLEVRRLLSGAQGAWARPERAVAKMEGHLLFGTTPAEVRHRVRVQIQDPDVHVDIEAAGPFNQSPVDPDIMGRIRQHAWIPEGPSQVVVPYMSEGPSDARHLRQRGRPVYGFTPLIRTLESKASIRGRNENVNLEDMRRGLRVLTHLVADLANRPTVGGATPQ